MNLNQLEYFVRTAEMGSLSKAAIVLNIAQSALSRQIRLLEVDLSVTLMLRNGRGIVLTEAGKRLFEHSIDILQLVSRVKEDIDASRDEPIGRIVVGLPPTMGRMLTLPLVEGFKRAFPKARLAIVEGLSTHLAEWVSTGRADIGLLHNPASQTSLEIIPVLQVPLVLVSPADSKADKNAAVKFDDLVNYPLIVPERAHAIRKLMEAQAALTGLKLNVAWEISSVRSILDLVRAGHGHAVLPRNTIAIEHQPEAFILRPLVEPNLMSTLCLAISAHKPVTPLTKHVMQLMRELIIKNTGDGLSL
ncbi:MAG TPA: LysR substrate-binding domain-containing protein [Gallionellaceae bacterium]|nr:LysR substrate-binding domain-containing protein [Gallionellaceae bacterium]